MSNILDNPKLERRSYTVLYEMREMGSEQVTAQARHVPTFLLKRSQRLGSVAPLLPRFTSERRLVSTQSTGSVIRVLSPLCAIG